jgi:hypothetical protein
LAHTYGIQYMPHSIVQAIPGLLAEEGALIIVLPAAQDGWAWDGRLAG